MQRILALILLASTGFLAGCTAMVAERLVQPPRSERQMQWTAQMLARARVAEERVERARSPDIGYAVFEPGNYGLRYRTWSYRDDTWSANALWHAPAQRAPARHGTVVLVHGWSMDAGMMLPWALAFAERGFRAVVVELRSHGRSQDGAIGYGQREADDVLAVLAQLSEQRRLAQPLYLFGVSYGAVTVLHASARMAVAADPPDASARTAQAAGGASAGRGRSDALAGGSVPAAVVAMEPFANAADAIRSMHTFATTALRGGWRRVLLRHGARMLVRPTTMEAAIQQASRQLQLDLARLDTRVAIAASSSCPLLLHGRIDSVIPHHSSRTLAAAHPAAQLVELPRDGHFSTPGRIDLLADPLADWFAAVARTGECVPFRAPRSTLLGYDGFEESRVPARQRPLLRDPGGAVSVDARE